MSLLYFRARGEEKMNGEEINGEERLGRGRGSLNLLYKTKSCIIINECEAAVCEERRKGGRKVALTLHV